MQQSWKGDGWDKDTPNKKVYIQPNTIVFLTNTLKQGGISISLIFHAQSLLKVVHDALEKVWGKPHQFVNL